MNGSANFRPSPHRLHRDEITGEKTRYGAKAAAAIFFSDINNRGAAAQHQPESSHALSRPVSCAPVSRAEQRKKDHRDRVECIILDLGIVSSLPFPVSLLAHPRPFSGASIAWPPRSSVRCSLSLPRARARRMQPTARPLLFVSFFFGDVKFFCLGIKVPAQQRSPPQTSRHGGVRPRPVQPAFAPPLVSWPLAPVSTLRTRGTFARSERKRVPTGSVTDSQTPAPARPSPGQPRISLAPCCWPGLRKGRRSITNRLDIHFGPSSSARLGDARCRRRGRRARRPPPPP